MRFLILLSLMVLSTAAQADFFVLYNKETGEVINSSSRREYFNVSSDDKSKTDVKLIKGNAEEFAAAGALQDYKVSGDKIVVNAKKLSEEASKRQESAARQAEISTIEQRAAKMAYEDLIKEGKIFKYINLKDFE